MNIFSLPHTGNWNSSHFQQFYFNTTHSHRSKWMGQVVGLNMKTITLWQNKKLCCINLKIIGKRQSSFLMSIWRSFYSKTQRVLWEMSQWKRPKCPLNVCRTLEWFSLELFLSAFWAVLRYWASIFLHSIWLCRQNLF